MKQLLIVMAKASEVGRVKTRLVPPLSADQAARLNGAMIRTTLWRMSHPEWDVELHLAGSARAGDGLVHVPVVAQAGEGLGERMLAATEHGFDRGYASVVLIGSDHPTVPVSYVKRAFRALDESDGVAIGPSEDGGYYLIGMTRPMPALFMDMTYSVDSVFDETRHRLTMLDVDVTVLPAWYDVDTGADLARLRNELAVSDIHDSELQAVLEDIGP